MGGFLSMVSNLSIIFMSISLIICLALPIGGIIYLKKKYNASLKPFFIGMLVFFITVQILEAPIHNYILKINKGTSEFLLSNPVFYMLYGGLMAGIFEETARLIAFKFLIKDRKGTTPIAYGVGHGGIEAILIGGISAINTISYSVLINNGKFQTLMESAGVSTEIINQTFNQLANSSSIYWLMPGIERMIAMVIQISLSVLVFYAVKERKYIFFFVAILCHALIDFPAALYQVGVLRNIYIVEVITLILAIVLATLVFSKLTKKFKKNDEII